jgi:hypothetical protein
MIIGFTGTRHGMTPAQLLAFEAVILSLAAKAFHHGDCVGADAEAAACAFGHGIRVIVHPPADVTHRAFTRGFDEIHCPLTHFARNREIVKACERLIACPFELEHQPRGGTWYTVDYARKQRKPVTIVWRDGRVEEWQG